MLSEPEILVLKLVSERRLLDDAGVARCVSLYKAARGSRSLSDILMKEGGIQREAAGQIGALYGCCQYDDSSPSLENNIRPTIPIRWHGAPPQTESLLLLVDDMSFKLGNRSWPLVLLFFCSWASILGT
mgnify:CR=1 FL=1